MINLFFRLVTPFLGLVADFAAYYVKQMAIGTKNLFLNPSTLWVLATSIIVVYLYAGNLKKETFIENAKCVQQTTNKSYKYEKSWWEDAFNGSK